MYFVTCIAYYPEKGLNSWIKGIDWRCFGYYKDFPPVEQLGHLEECLYNYMIIEKFEEGVHPEAKKIFWYINNDKRQWDKIDRENVPEDIRYPVNWGIG